MGLSIDFEHKEKQMLARYVEIQVSIKKKRLDSCFHFKPTFFPFQANNSLIQGISLKLQADEHL
jgi:hypothetical protein